MHRDLKPSNVKLRPDGTLKVLDFGLAKSLDGHEAAPASSQSPTLTSPVVVTQGGTILGTAAYMSPEQARGQSVDERTDVWAFGCVLMEMLTGKLAFQGANVSDMIASVLRGEPSWSDLPAEAAPVVPVLRRCLEKDPARRYRDAADVMLVLEDAVKSSSGGTVAAASPPRSWRVPIAATVGLLAGAALVGLAGRTGPRPEAAPSPLRRFELTPPPGAPFRASRQGWNVAIAPDASRVVYTSKPRGVSGLVVRELDRLDARFVAGSEDGLDPFLSPDGTQIGFTTYTELKRVPAAGGPAETICPLDTYFSGATWGPDDTIVFTQGILGLFRVAATGGEPERLAVPDIEKGEKGYFRPSLLPDGQTVLYTLIFTDGATRIVARRLGGGEPVTIVQDGFGPRYRPSGHLVYGQGDRLMAVRFDAATLRTVGQPVQVQGGVFNKPEAGVTNIVSASDGTSVYVAGHSNPPTGRLVWLDRGGKRVCLGRGRAARGAAEPPHLPRWPTRGHDRGADGTGRPALDLRSHRLAPAVEADVSRPQHLRGLVSRRKEARVPVASRVHVPPALAARGRKLDRAGAHRSRRFRGPASRMVAGPGVSAGPADAAAEARAAEPRRSDELPVAADAVPRGRRPLLARRALAGVRRGRDGRVGSLGASLPRPGRARARVA